MMLMCNIYSKLSLKGFVMNCSVIIENFTANTIDCLEVNPCSVRKIVVWYASHHAGDTYDVNVDGVRQRLDHNGHIV